MTLKDNSTEDRIKRIEINQTLLNDNIALLLTKIEDILSILQKNESK